MKKLKLSLVVTLALLSILVLSACTMPMVQTCTVHRDLNKDTYCDVCQAYVPVNCPNHLDENHDGMCDTKGCTMMLTPMHYDNDCNGKCDVCNYRIRIKHDDSDADGFCDKCNADLTLNCEHEDEDGDYLCDLCNKALPKCEHVDENGDLICDLCEREIEIIVCEHVDANFDGRCDKCKEVMPDSIPLVSGGVMNFQFVLYQGAPLKQVQVIDKFISELQSSVRLDVSEWVSDNPQTVKDYEILIGSCSSRGEEYNLDPHVYGPKGYAIKVIGTKILVLFGSDDTFDVALAALKSEIIGITEETPKVRNRYISDKNNIELVQDDYKISALTLNGQDMRDFTIAVDKTNEITLSAAAELQDIIYNNTGYWLEIVSLDEKDKSIVISLEERSSDPEQRYNNKGFKVTCLDSRIEFVAEYPTAYMPYKKNDVLERNSLATEYFKDKFYKAESKTLNLVSETDDYEKDIRFVNYKDFGAVSGDKMDDSEAIRATHEYANLGGHKVIADPAASYDIFDIDSEIIVETDVDWQDAKFYLHDDEIAPTDTYIDKDGKTKNYRDVYIFKIERSEDAVRVNGLSAKINELNANGGIDASTFKSFNLNFGRPMLVVVANSYHTNYIRYGVNASAGQGQQEVILVDKDGNLDDSTPFMFDYEYITSIACYPIDDVPLTIEGGIFTTYPYTTDTPQEYTTYGRGIRCARSNTTFKGIKHLLDREGNYNKNKHGNTEDYGCPYSAFYSTTFCNNIRYLDCQASGHLEYKGSNGAGMGTYDISPGNSINIVYEGCYQDEENFFNRTYVKDEDGNDTAIAQSRWGIMGSNGNKNITFLNSKLTRFDAHSGVHNVYIIGSDIKYIRIVGTGMFRMEDSVMYEPSPIVSLRSDYGGFWHGNVVVKNCKMIGSPNINFINTDWYNHYFGYDTAYPSNILIDGLEAGTLSNNGFYSDEAFTPYDKTTVHVFGPEANGNYLTGIYAGAHKATVDYLPATDDNNVVYDTNGTLATQQKYYPNGKPVVVPNKNQTPPFERIIIKNCDESISFVLPNKAKYPWFANTVISYNETTECNQHFDCFGDGDNLCDDCGAEMTACAEHLDTNNDGRCAICFADVPIKCEKHIDKDINCKCDICHVHYECPGHVDSNEDTICDICGGVLGCHNGKHTDPGQHTDKLGAHIDENGDRYCDNCRSRYSTALNCEKNIDGMCDKCGKEAKANSVCEINDGYCDLCTKLIPACDTCVDEKDENSRNIRDGKCDKCMADMVALISPCDECVDTDENGVCDRCLEDMPALLPCEHEDAEAPIGKCDKCGDDIPAEE